MVFFPRFYTKFCRLGVLLLIASSYLIGCASKADKQGSISIERINERDIRDTISIKNNALDYEIIILEFGFDNWMQTQKPPGYYTKDFLVRMNKQMVTEYNARVADPIRNSRDLYPMLIEYNFDTDYGYEVNYLLYHYFLFFQEKYRQKLR